MRRVICPRSDKNGHQPSSVPATPSSEESASIDQFGKENTMKKITKSLLTGIVGVATALSGYTHAQLQQLHVKNIVLVHGAFADGTSWAKVIPILEARGFHVVAVQNPLTSLSGDVDATRRIIAMQDGPVILVGHSWGGAVISEVGDDPKVAGLVYVAAYVPDVGMSANACCKSRKKSLTSSRKRPKAVRGPRPSNSK